MNIEIKTQDQSPHFFRGGLPDDVPMATPQAIRATVGLDMDRLEVLIFEPDDNPGFFVTALVLLNKARDEGYYFRGLVDEDGSHTVFQKAKDVVEALREIADEGKVELDMYTTGGRFNLPGDPADFYFQLRTDNVHWRKNDEPKLLDSSCIPAGPSCFGCPYAKQMPNKPEQADGYCAYIDRGDWMVKLGFSLLWDGLKECRINEG